MKKILIIQGHPDKESYNQALFERYKSVLVKQSIEIETLELWKMNFDPNLHHGYRKRTELEPDLVEAQEKLKRADHIVLIFPLWWGSMPALLKGFFDRILLPGFAFKKHDNSVWWDKYLTGKSARVIVTMDQPPWFFRLMFSRPAYNAVKKMTFQFVGISKVKYNPIGTIRRSSDKQRRKWLDSMEKFATSDRR